MGLFSWLTNATPGGVIGEAGSQVLGGLFKGIESIIDEFHVSAEEKVQMKLAIAQQKLDFYKAQTDDIQNARAMQMTTRSIWPGIMSTISTVGFFGGFAYLVIYGLPPELDEFSKTIINMFAGAIIAGYISSKDFWLGSTASGQNKDQMIFHSTANSALPKKVE